MPKRVYNKDEISRLIQRAAELEAERSASDRDGLPAGLSINELEQIAAESGIDPELMQQAANELDAEFSPGKKTGSKSKTKVKTNEIVCERWIEARPEAQIMDDLVIELNHRYGTSHKDINWWDNLWSNYAGKAKVRKTSGSLEWEYTNEWESHIVRVLLQNRGNRFRIRVSKRQSYGFEWNAEGKAHWIYLPLLVVLTVIGGVFGNVFADSALLGIAAGILLSVIVFPFAKVYSMRSLQKHRDEVTETADELADFTLQLIEEAKTLKTSSKIEMEQKMDTSQIEIRDESEKSGSGSQQLKNNLKE